MWDCCMDKVPFKDVLLVDTAIHFLDLHSAVNGSRTRVVGTSNSFRRKSTRGQLLIRPCPNRRHTPAETSAGRLARSARHRGQSDS
jgi:hypothetical protein